MARRFGIELEHANQLTHGLLAVKLQEAGLRVDCNVTGQYNSRGVYNGWQVKYDSTIRVRRPYSYQIELVSPPLPFDSTGKEQVSKAVAIANETGKVNRSCGFHVHVEANDLNAAQLSRLTSLFNTWKKVLMSYVAASRRNNHFCQPEASRTNRYVALNLVPFSIRGTVEFRLHQGTLNAQKILSFVALCVNLVERAKSNRPLDTVEKDPAARGDDSVIRKVYRGQEFVVTKDNGNYNWNGTAYPTLSAVATAIGRTFGRARVSGPSFFGNPMTGNAMDQLCREIGLDSDVREFLASTYDRAITQWGYYNG